MGNEIKGEEMPSVYRIYGKRSDGREWLIETVGSKAEVEQTKELFADAAPFRVTFGKW